MKYLNVAKVAKIEIGLGLFTPWIYSNPCFIPGF